MSIKKIKEINISQYCIQGNVQKILRIIFISDLHESPIDNILNNIKNIHPNLILLGGDIIHNKHLFKNGLKFFNETALIAPTLCCIGNHERLFGDDILSEIIKSGVIPLDDSAIQFKDINIGGLSSPVQEYNNTVKGKDRVPNLDWLSEYEKIKGYKILLCHQPEYYDKYIREHNIDLVLSGHAHGGQWRIGNQGVYAPGQGLFPKYTAGIYENRLIVSRGIGNAYLIPRINNKPEIIVITLIPH